LVTDFITAMCSGEKGQLKILAGFNVKNAALHKAVKEKTWTDISSRYNGPSFKKFSYDTQLENAYNAIKKNGVA
jgi:hypothetical protein